MGTKMPDNAETEKKGFTITWKVENVSYLWQPIASPEFVARNMDSSILRLELKPSIWQSNQKVVCCINKKKYPGTSPLDCELSFVNSNGTSEESIVEKEIQFKDYSNHGDEYQGGTALSVTREDILEQKRSSYPHQDTLTIRCRLWKTEGECAESGQSFARSRIEVETQSFVWTLENFSGDWSYSERNLIRSSDKIGYLRLKSFVGGGSVSGGRVQIEVLRYGGEKVFCTLQISVLDISGTCVESTVDEYLFEKRVETQVWRFPPLISKSKLMASKKQLLPNDALSLKCEFTVSLGTVVNETHVATWSNDVLSLLGDMDDSTVDTNNINVDNSPVSSRALQEDLKRLLEAGDLCDMTIRVGEEEFPVHKAVLAARSPVFKALLKSDVRENATNTVDIKDLDADTIRRLLLYVYSGSVVDLEWEAASRLYFAADKYGILSLKQKCSLFLKTNLKFSNVGEVLVVADLHQDDDLKSAVHDFISRHEYEVLCSDEWRDLEKNNSSLAFKTLREVCLKKSG